MDIDRSNADGLKNKARRLVDYLTEIARLRTKLIRHIEEYDRVLWMYDVPGEPQYCFTQAWGPDDNYETDVWLEITKYDEPVLSDVPKICERWIDYSLLYDTENPPKLYPEIFLASDDSYLEKIDNQKIPPATDNEFITLRSNDFPEIIEVWDEYIGFKWIPWSNLHKKWQTVNEVYSKLFSIFQEEQKLGEEYELVLGLGLLRWKTPSNQKVKRHILIAKANLLFEADKGKFTVTPSSEGASLALELDMLDVQEQPLNAKKIIDEALLAGDDDPWDLSTIEPILRSFANLVDEKGRGSYQSNELEPSYHRDKEKPVVDFAPALILRKRSAKGLVAVLSDIKRQIDEDTPLPPEFKKLCEGQIDSGTFEGEYTRLFSDDPTVYFPKPSNEEQRQIIRNLKNSNGVLVQGPPGTGKSHTIANLICHLLATGQRVLVTAKTPRALKVLKNQLPEQIRPLCINLLGSGLEEQRSLESSVSNILAKHDRRNDKSAIDKIDDLKNKIKNLRSEKARLNTKIRSIREKDTFQHSLIEGNYKGTAAKIASRLCSEENQFDWLNDEISHETKIPLSQNIIIESYHELSSINSEEQTTINFILPKIGEDVPSSDSFEKVVNKYKLYKKELNKYSSFANSKLGKALVKGDIEHIKKIYESTTILKSKTESILNKPFPWIKEAINDVLSDKTNVWKDIYRLSEESLRELKDKAKFADKLKISFPQNINFEKLLSDSENLKRHFDSGGKLGRGPFKPKIIKENKYIIESVVVDGVPCNNSGSINKLIDYLKTIKGIEFAYKLWHRKISKKDEPFTLQVSKLEESNNILKSIIDLNSLLLVSKKAISLIKPVQRPSWNDLLELSNIIKVCRALILFKEFQPIAQSLKNLFSNAEVFSSKERAHPISKKILTIMKKGNPGEYSESISKLKLITKNLDRMKNAEKNLEKLSGAAPILGETLRCDLKSEIWNERLKLIDKAWHFKRAKSWLNNFLEQDDLKVLERRLFSLENELNSAMADLSAMKAWQFCLERMEDSHRQHLMAWQQSIKKIGKGTGKHAPKHRRNAKMHLNKCREAVPAWVMPLHRVYETVKVTPGLFDFIIVDEASQCGPEALPLCFLAKKLLVVGDEHQISPEAVGVTRDHIDYFMKHYLSDFEHADSFDLESSLFDHGKRRFGNRIVLREHFRCVPEIIRFSNDLCYSSTPLIPLRQYPPNRLEPLNTVYVNNGYREGRQNNVINRPEAEALADIVEECCNDDVYEGKTMGVIVLQGEAQAFLIENMLLDKLGAEEMQQRRLICGNPYSFQGDERDVIFMSMVAASNERIGPFTRPADQRRFNVAASRAKDQVWLFHSVTTNDLSEHCLRRRLLKYFQNPEATIDHGLGENIENLHLLAKSANRIIENAPSPFESWFELDVALKIADRGYKVSPQYPVVENKRIDMVVEGELARLAVECDGDHWHGPDQYDNDTERQRMLERCGWTFLRIRECEFNANQQTSLDPLWAKIDSMNIQPLTKFAYDEAGDKPDEDIEIEQEMAESAELTDQEAIDKKEQKKSSTIKEGPKDIQDALNVKPSKIRKAIIKVLKERPNCSCVKRSLSTFILKDWQIVTRGNPRKSFERRVNQAISYLEKKSILKVYKTSKNVRVKLMGSISEQEDLPFDKNISDTHRKWEPDSEETKNFIYGNVKKLGSVENVKNFYSSDSQIDKYANRLAEELLK